LLFIPSAIWQAFMGCKHALQWKNSNVHKIYLLMGLLVAQTWGAMIGGGNSDSSGQTQ